jgi:hypothetical protein
MKKKTKISECELITEELSRDEIQEVKDLIRVQMTKLFYTLYVKKTFWKD